MSKYTTELRFIDKSEIFDFDFEMYGEDDETKALHKQEFIDRFYTYYYFDEINGDTLNEFNRWCERTMAEWLPLFNERFAKQKSLMSQNLLNRVRSFTGTTEDEYERASSGENSGRDAYLDTPQTPLGTQEDDYATSINKSSSSFDNSDDGTSSSTTNVNESVTMKLPLEVWNDYYKYFKDLDMELIRKFKECFYVIY